MAQIHIKRAIERVPGGMMIVPLLIGSLIATFMPGMPKFFGSFTNALFTGALPILAVFYVCMGASIGMALGMEKAHRRQGNAVPDQKGRGTVRRQGGRGHCRRGGARALPG